MNLVSNAAEAQPDGGTITIFSRREYLKTPLHGYQPIPSGDYVILSVSDEEEGIPETELKRIFEPFFTRKVMGRSGTGLGLTVVWGMVEDHKGFIDIISLKDKGTSINIYFPAAGEENLEIVETVIAENTEGKGETILVVDDDTRQREIASDILSRLNYSAKTVASGEEALEYLRLNDVDLVILDMIMEDSMDGLETFREIIAIKPSQKAIIASGYSATDRVKQAQNLGAGPYLQKPYTVKQIGELLQRELAKV